MTLIYATPDPLSTPDAKKVQIKPNPASKPDNNAKEQRVQKTGCPAALNSRQVTQTCRSLRDVLRGADRRRAKPEDRLQIGPLSALANRPSTRARPPDTQSPASRQEPVRTRTNAPLHSESPSSGLSEKAVRQPNNAGPRRGGVNVPSRTTCQPNPTRKQRWDTQTRRARPAEPLRGHAWKQEG
jgi:hypothetical protein